MFSSDCHPILGVQTCSAQKTMATISVDDMSVLSHYITDNIREHLSFVWQECRP